MLTTFVKFFRRAALAVVLAATSSLAAATTIHVSIDTSNFGTDSGLLDMNLSFLPGVPLATATLSNFSGFSKADRDDQWSWGFDDIAGGYVLNNNEDNYLSHMVSFGGTLGFDLTFDGLFDERTLYVSHFAITAYDHDLNPLGNFNPANNALLEYTWTPAPVSGGQGTVGTVPEPGILLLMGTGVAGMLLARRRRSGQQAA